YITNPGGSEITITYTADGEKLSKTSPTETRNYVSGIEYLGNALDAIYHGEGRCTPNGASAFYYEYTIKDHLGNARINFRANGAAVTFLQELHYYPFFRSAWSSQSFLFPHPNRRDWVFLTHRNLRGRLG
ncbi:MAG TPA: hypothetical protein DCF33_09860, partial [Saprospirales bacterium]|nr:hypothetical protein [Saprospirales bacterium]